MIIQSYGLSCLKFTVKPSGRGTDEVTMLLNPFDKSVGIKSPILNADIVIFSHSDASYRTQGQISEKSFVIDTPGEFAIQGVVITGRAVPADSDGGTTRGNAVLYRIEAEDLVIGIASGIGGSAAPSVEDIFDGADVLVVPVGEGAVSGFDGAKAASLVRRVESKVVIPVHYHITGLAERSLEERTTFCAAIGNCPSESVARFVVKKKDLEGKNSEIVLLGAA